ncbi:MAG: copper oxidase [Bacteroidetes bacterium]|nr:MAG: copper oxidase [Bacteroidota bacterium]
MARQADNQIIYQSDSTHTVYHLYVKDTVVNYTSKKRSAIAINGTIPAPILNFTEGDTAVIYIHNNAHAETSIHLHGLILPNQYDGVPYLTTQPIKKGTTHLYKFPIVQHGTYWYHSHTKFQEQDGMYGAIIIKERPKSAIKEFTWLVSDWTNERSYEVDRSLHAATDWYAIRKGSTQDYVSAIKEGYFKTKVTNEWKRMMAMDVSDIAYDQFFSNGSVETFFKDAKPGEQVRIRLINGSSSTYFWIQFAGGKLKVIANDGMDVEPVDVDRLIIGVAETYDFIVTVPENKQTELRATSEDRTGYTSVWLGNGEKAMAPTLPKLKYFEGMKMMNGMMDMNGNMKEMGMEMSNQAMDMNSVMYPELQSGSQHSMDMDHASDSNHHMEESKEFVTLNYSMLRSPVSTLLPEAPFKTLKFDLTGNMNRYVWTINNKTVSESDKILIKKGENLRIILFNNTMMRHPMHLHGHFFRVLNGQGVNAPLKNTLDIMPMERDTLEFAATESGDWFFHCHILYHMMSGMGRIFSYEDSPPNPEVPDPKMAMKMVNMDDRMIHPYGNISLESNGTDGEFFLAGTRNRFQTEWRIGLNDESGYESESHFGRFLGRTQFWFPYIGWDFRYRKYAEEEKNMFGQTTTKDDRKVFCAGLAYTLPMLIVADFRLDSKGKIRLQFGREDVPLSKRFRMDFKVNSDREYMAGLRYVVSKYFALSTHYDSDMKWGAGIRLNY